MKNYTKNKKSYQELLKKAEESITIKDDKIYCTSAKANQFKKSDINKSIKVLLKDLLLQNY